MLKRCKISSFINGNVDSLRNEFTQVLPGNYIARSTKISKFYPIVEMLACNTSEKNANLLSFGVSRETSFKYLLLGSKLRNLSVISFRFLTKDILP